jgi:hypothetical protein
MSLIILNLCLNASFIYMHVVKLNPISFTLVAQAYWWFVSMGKLCLVLLSCV